MLSRDNHQRIIQNQIVLFNLISVLAKELTGKTPTADSRLDDGSIVKTNPNVQMKNHRRLNNITVRWRRKVTVHRLIPVIVTQAMALAYPESPRNCAL